MSAHTVCRVCLVNNLNLYGVRKDLQVTYERITTEKYNKVGCPLFMCYICIAVLRKCHRFMKTAQVTNNMLKQWCNQQNKKRVAQPLSIYSISKMELISLENSESSLNHDNTNDSHDDTNDNQIDSNDNQDDTNDNHVDTNDNHDDTNDNHDDTNDNHKDTNDNHDDLEEEETTHTVKLFEFEDITLEHDNVNEKVVSDLEKGNKTKDKERTDMFELTHNNDLIVEIIDMFEQADNSELIVEIPDVVSTSNNIVEAADDQQTDCSINNYMDIEKSSETLHEDIHTNIEVTNIITPPCNDSSQTTDETLNPESSKIEFLLTLENESGEEQASDNVNKSATDADFDSDVTYCESDSSHDSDFNISISKRKKSKGKQMKENKGGKRMQRAEDSVSMQNQLCDSESSHSSHDSDYNVSILKRKQAREKHKKEDKEQRRMQHPDESISRKKQLSDFLHRKKAEKEQKREDEERKRKQHADESISMKKKLCDSKSSLSSHDSVLKMSILERIKAEKQQKREDEERLRKQLADESISRKKQRSDFLLRKKAGKKQKREDKERKRKQHADESISRKKQLSDFLLRKKAEKKQKREDEDRKRKQHADESISMKKQLCDSKSSLSSHDSDYNVSILKRKQAREKQKKEDKEQKRMQHPDESISRNKRLSDFLQRKKAEKEQKREDEERKRKQQADESISMKKQRLCNNDEPIRSENEKEKKIKPSCKNCHLSCNEKFTEDIREKLFTKFWDNKNHVQIISKLVSQKKKNNSTDKIKLDYNLPINKKLQKVCKIMFLNTLGITEDFVYKALSKHKNCDENNDTDDEHQINNFVITDELKQSVIGHVNSFKPVDAYYTLEGSTLKYLSSTLKISVMYESYPKWCLKNKYSNRVQTLREYQHVINSVLKPK